MTETKAEARRRLIEKADKRRERRKAMKDYAASADDHLK
jgi:hypothetical protein